MSGSETGMNVIVLAAGAGTRMNSDRPKVLHELAGAPLVIHAIRAAEPLSPDRLIVVTGHGAAEVETAVRNYAPDATFAKQTERRGTGHAVAQARAALQGADGDALILYGDTPFIQPETVARIQAARTEGADVVVLGFDATDPGRYGRLVTKGDDLEAIVEWKDADAETRAITLCNSGVIAADTALLFDLLDAVTDDNAAKEYYLTDIVGIARARGLTARVVRCEESETLGINSRPELAAAEAAWQARARATLMEDGVTLVQPDSIVLAYDTAAGRDAVIEGPCVCGPGVTIESGARIRPFCHLEGCHVSRGAVIGPFARLRPGANLAEDVRIGNFVEVKNAEIAEGAKVNHLSYVGDATIGARSNIGAGTITCNYDGVFKHRTTLGDDVFVGSSTMLVAPVIMGDGAMSASGSVVTRDVPPGALAIGRARQQNKDGFARRMFEKLKSAKASARGKG